MWINSEGTLTPKQREFGPYVRAPPFVATRRSAILVPGFYAEKKKRSLCTLGDIDSGRTSDSSRGRSPEQPHGVTASNNINIEDEQINASLRYNEGDGITREDSISQNRVKEIIIEDLKTPNETKIAGEISNEELSLAQEFGVANLLGLGSSLIRSPSTHDNLNACDNLSENPTLKKSHAAKESRVHKSPNSHAAPTRTRRERKKPKGNMAASFQVQGRKRMARTEVDHTQVSAKRLQVALSGENKTFVVVGADVQPRQQQWFV